MTRPEIPPGPERWAPAGPGGLVVWRARVTRALRLAATPCFVFAEEPLEERAHRLAGAFAGLPVRHWWSMKTLSLRPLLAWWKARGGGVEVVSEFELQGALALGFPVGNILVNGPAKDAWLPRWSRPGMRVNFDSLAELQALAPRARRERWRVGVRLLTRAEGNLEFPGERSQFGVLPGELSRVARLMRRHGLRPETIHFHLGTNLPSARCYQAAIEEVSEAVAAMGWQPSILDLGGGFPAEGVTDREGRRLDRDFQLAEVRSVIERALGGGRSWTEVGMENGRWWTAPAAVLALRVLAVKEGRLARVLIADGGRTLQAMVATWERHAMASLRRRTGAVCPTLVCGPTCMTFDTLGRHALPRTMTVGDVLLWRDAGAYQLSWETRFSHGAAAVVGCRGREAAVWRAAEGFPSWWATR